MNRATLRRFGYPIATGLAVLGLLLGIYAAIVHLRTDPMADARAYYDAATRLNEGQPLYVDVANSEVPGAYYYPPLLAILFRPLALLPYEAAALIWSVVVVGATVLTFRRIGLRRPVLIVAGWLALPILWTVTIGQAEALITLLLAIGAPWTVALAANIKLFPMLVAVYWVGRREWRRLGTFAACMAALVAFQFIVEPAATLAYLDFLTSREVGDVNNLSLYAISPVVWAVSVAVIGILALRYAPTRWGWAAAVVLSVFASPRLLSYQLSTLLAGFGGPDVARTSGASGDQRRTGPDAIDQ